MSLRLVIPAGAKPGDVAFPGRKDTWFEVAASGRADGIELFGSEWCLEHGIDGLGFCTEESGQESAAQRAARETREAADQAARDTKEKAGSVQFGALLDLLVDKGIIDVGDAATVDGTAGET